MAERLRTGLQSRVHRFESGPHLQVFINVLQLKKFNYYIHNSGVAQLVEQATVNRWVTGSSPVAGAIVIFNQFFRRTNGKGKFCLSNF